MKTKLLGLFLMLSCMCSMQAQSSYAQEFKKFSPTMQGYLEFSGMMKKASYYDPELIRAAIQYIDWVGQGIPWDMIPLLSDEYLEPVEGGAAFDGVVGARLNKCFFVGLGAGVQFNIKNAKRKMTGLRMTNLNIPVYADFRLFFPTPKENVFPYLELSIGPNIWIYNRLTFYPGPLWQSNPWQSEKNIVQLKDDFSRVQRDDISLVLAHFRANIGVEVGCFTCGLGYELHGNTQQLQHYGFVKIGLKLGKDLNL